MTERSDRTLANEAGRKTGNGDDTARDLLRRAVTRLFAVTDEVADAIAAAARLETFPASRTIVHQGEVCPRSWLLVLGRVHAVAVGISGQSVQLNEYKAGDILGALPGESGERSDAELVADVDSEALGFEPGELLALAGAHASVGLTLTQALVARLRATSQRMFAQATLTAAGRVHAELYRLVDESESQLISPAPIMTELARQVSTTRETASRTVSALERRGIVRREEDGLFVVAPARLQELIV
ncbi:MAG: Crp/Fnr family transcriptional regulator [Pacificimonas sp.]